MSARPRSPYTARWAPAGWNCDATGGCWNAGPLDSCQGHAVPQYSVPFYGIDAFTHRTSREYEEHMILRKLAIGIILAAIVVTIIVASGIAFFDRPAAVPEKPTVSASAQKRGGVLRVFQYDSPASMSIHEE